MVEVGSARINGLSSMKIVSVKLGWSRQMQEGCSVEIHLLRGWAVISTNSVATATSQKQSATDANCSSYDINLKASVRREAVEL